MPLDGMTLSLLRRELYPCIVGSRIEKVHQPSKDELVFHLRTREGAYKLLISASANSPRLHLISLSLIRPRRRCFVCCSGST